MRVALTTICNQDGVQRYRHTFVNLYQGEKLRGIVYVHAIDTNAIRLSDVEGEKVYTVKDKDISIETFMPHAQWKQHGNNSFLILRVPARQWKRSLSNTTHHITYDVQMVGAKAFDREKHEKVSFPDLNYRSLTDLQRSFDAVETGFAEAWKKVTEGNAYSCAIAGKYCLFKYGQLYLGGVEIAKFYPKQNAYKVNALFREELADLTRGFTFKEVLVNGTTC